MEKYFGSTSQSSIFSNKNVSAFSSMIALSPKPKPNELSTSQKSIQEKSFNEKPFAIRKESSRIATLVPTSGKLSFKSV
jgi:hypothetical protein